MTRAEIEAQIKEKREQWQAGKATADALFSECRRLETEMRKAQHVLGEQNSKINSINREIDGLLKLLADADLPQFPVILNGRYPQSLVLVKKTPQRIYVRFAGMIDYGDWISMKGKTRDEGWSLDVPAFLAWAKEQQV